MALGQWKRLKWQNRSVWANFWVERRISLDWVMPWITVDLNKHKSLCILHANLSLMSKQTHTKVHIISFAEDSAESRTHTHSFTFNLYTPCHTYKHGDSNSSVRLKCDFFPFFNKEKNFRKKYYMKKLSITIRIARAANRIRNGTLWTVFFLSFHFNGIFHLDSWHSVILYIEPADTVWLCFGKRTPITSNDFQARWLEHPFSVPNWSGNIESLCIFTSTKWIEMDRKYHYSYFLRPPIILHMF